MFHNCNNILNKKLTLRFNNGSKGNGGFKMGRSSVGLVVVIVGLVVGGLVGGRGARRTVTAKGRKHTVVQRQVEPRQRCRQ